MTETKHRTWKRTCQECGNKQRAKPQTGEPTKNYCNSKCRKCKSMALDYGKWEYANSENDWGPE